MEDVLDLYEEPYDPDRPVVCFDETSKQLTADKSPGIPAKPGQAQRYDYEYKRNGTRNLFMFCEPLRGWRHLEVTERRTAQDFAHQMKWLVDEAYPEAQVVRLVLDNLNTHKLGSLYETHTPAEARRIAKRLELHHTPKHGSWLNMAEIEFSVFSRQCLNRRIGDEQELKRETAALEDERNRVPATIEWRFSTFDARLKLQHIYPSHSACNGTSSVLSKPNRPYPGSATASWCPPDSERHSRSWQRHRGEPRCRHGHQRDRWSRARRTGSDDRDRPGTRRREIDHGSRE